MAHNGLQLNACYVPLIFWLFSSPVSNCFKFINYCKMLDFKEIELALKEKIDVLNLKQMLNRITEQPFCQTRVMLSFFSLFFVRWVYFFGLIFSELR